MTSQYLMQKKTMDVFAIGNLLNIPNFKNLKKKNAYTNPYTFPQLQKQVALDDDTRYRQIQDTDKYFKALIVPKSLASTI